MDYIPIAGPSITQKEIGYVTDAVTNGWYTNAGHYQARFEAAFADYVGRQYALALPSCTAALHLSLLAAGVGRGDEVIVPESTWIGTAAPISYTGADPVFADIDSESWCLDVRSFKDRITSRTKAVIVVDLYGNLPKMDDVLGVAEQHNLIVIEDAAQAIGAEYKGSKAGSFGFASTFSFHGTKTLTTGEGGMLVTDKQEVYDRCRYLSDHGRAPGMFWNTEIAYKYRMSGLQAALGLAQLERVEELVEFKRRLFDLYRQELSDLATVRLNPDPEHVNGTYWMVTVVVDPDLGITTEALMSALAEKGIATRPFFYPLSSLPAYGHLPGAASANQINPVAYGLAKSAVNLPSGYHMTEEKVRFVCRSLETVLTRSVRAKIYAHT
jgi:perosamine synthetase